jgi:crossover junction endodeoxyribonuclease RusA
MHPISGQIAISMRFFYERGKTVTRQHPTVPPDLDKQIRSILDALTGVAYVDDSQVTHIKATKEYGAPGSKLRLQGALKRYEIVIKNRSF